MVELFEIQTVFIYDDSRLKTLEKYTVFLER